MTINFKRSEAQEASLRALLAAQQDPASPSYHKWLTPAQFGQQFGMSTAVWPKSRRGCSKRIHRHLGCPEQAMPLASVVVSHPSREAFQTESAQLRSVHKAKPISPIPAPVTLPAALERPLDGVHGLDNFTLKPRIRRPKFTAGNGGAHYLTRGDLRVICDVSTPCAAGPFRERNSPSAVVGRTDIVPADVADFRAAAGLHGE